MTETHPPSTVVIALVAVATVVVLAGGLVGGRQETHQVETHNFVADDHTVGEAVVLSKTQRGGFSFFGYAVRQPNHYVQVAFTLPSRCDVGDAEQWPTNRTGCTGPAGLVGSIAGTGHTAAGNTIVMVETLVVPDCYANTALGVTWPPPTAHCELEP